jgi:hypothetical protein
MPAPRLPDSKIAATVLLSSPNITVEHLTYRAIGEIVDLAEKSVRRIRSAVQTAPAGVDPLGTVFRHEHGHELPPEALDSARRAGARLLIEAFEQRQAADARRIARFTQYLADQKDAA